MSESREQVAARELADALTKRLWPLIGEEDFITERDGIQPLLARVLAACALREAKWWAKYHGKDYNGEGTARIAELERAAEGGS